MESDLKLICALWELDHAHDNAKARLRQLKQAVDDAEAEITKIAAEQQDNQDTTAKVVTKEAKLQSELDAYVRRRDKAAVLMEGGSALDYLAVERQHIQCSERVDNLEVAVLECMEEQEGLVAVGSDLAGAMMSAMTVRDAARATWIQEGRILGADMKRYEAERAEAWSTFPRDLQRNYLGLRKRSREVITDIIDGNCGACSITANPQAVIETRLGRRLHMCRGCSRWFRRVAEPEPLDAPQPDA